MELGRMDLSMSPRTPSMSAPSEGASPPEDLGPPGWTRRRVALVVVGAVAVVPLTRQVIRGAEPGAGATSTSFGSVQILRADRGPRLAGGPAHGHVSAASPSPAPGNHTWADRVVLEVEVRNGTADPVLFSPGQLRLRVGRDGTTVTPEDADRAPGGLEPGTTERVRISYLAPSGVSELAAELSEPGGAPVVLDLPPVWHGRAARP